ncbi:MAG: nucleotidyltransferase family protein [Nitrospirae bacterium]|nr:nucleotidyltransferase family protein [Nitrospirota bacterium]
MDFRRVLTALIESFNREGIRYAALGGFAVSALGVQRSTADLDFLAHKDDLAKVGEVMTALGYRKVHVDQNVSHYQAEDRAWGCVDFIHAFRPLSVAMLTRAKPLPVLEGSFVLRVLEPEDLIGFKIQGMANNPLRESFDLSDIHALVRIHASGLDWARVKQYCEAFEMTPLYEDLERKFRCR